MRILAVPAALLVLAATSPRQGGDEVLRVSAVRFYQAASATTTIEGVCEVRLAALLRGVSQVSRYRVEVRVLDSAGLELQHSDWARDVPASLAQARTATVVESFGFEVAPGRYRVRVRLVPSMGDAVERTVDVAGYAAAPAISDLLLASGVRQPGSDTEPLGQGEVRRSGLVMRTAPVPRLTPAEATLSWYAELYPRSGSGLGELQAEVLGTGRRRIVAAAPRPVSIPSGGGVTHGSLDLSGLPEGDYVLRLRIRLGDSSVVAEAPFAMGSVASLVASGAIGDAAFEHGARAADLFEGASEARLDSLSAPLVFVARNPRDFRLYQTLTPEGKQRFLREFWGPSGVDRRIQGSVERDEFYRAVAFVDAAYRESGAAQVPGWNTDRGRIYLRNGRPDEMLARPAASPAGFEVWKYTRNRPRWYIFRDQTGMGHFSLLASNDVREVGFRQQNWEGVLGVDGTKDAYAFLGMDIRNLGTNINP